MQNSDLTTLLNLLNANNEWLITGPSGAAFSLRSNEIEIETAADKILISFIDKEGFQTWRIAGIEFDRSKILLDLSRNFGTENLRFELVPRTLAAEFSETVEIARLQRANDIAKRLIAKFPGGKLIRVELNRENGRFAQIILENKDHLRSAIISDVSESLSPELLLAFAVIWFSRIGRRKKDPIVRILILSEKNIAGKLQKLHACLTGDWKEKVRIYEISGNNLEAKIVETKPLKISGLWRYKPRKLNFLKNSKLTETSREIIKLAPFETDHIYSKNGETLRYLGLPFLRTRRISGEEKAWFGVEKDREILNEGSYEDFFGFFKQLKIYRTFNTPNSQHIFYQMAPEAWLESILRQNIKLLDSNLILSPIYNQFRTSQDKIDLLALRRDGRLVIIELKVSADREMIFQAVDYWRKIELQRRKGDLNKANLFGELEIADKPAIVYLVAPTLSYHRDFEFLSKTISQEIEIFRFDLAENWRENLKVLGRTGMRDT